MRSDSIPPAASPAPASVTRDPKPNSAAVAINNIAAGSGSSGGAPSATPVAQIDAMVDLLGEQRSLLQNRRQWKEEDQTLAKQQRSMQASVDKLERSIHAMLADWGVESVEQLEEQQKGKQEHLKLAGQLQGAEQRIRSMLAGHVPYDTMAQWLSPEHRHELEKRWESLTHRMQQARSRVDQLLQRQGEVSQEMKTLASDRRLAEVQLEMATLEKQIQVGRSRWKTLAATHRMLEQVCEVYETQRQPETLREASGFLKQLTGGKYTRIWTQLGKNQLRIDNQSGQALPLEVLSRGTREAVFIALRLALASAFSRRGVAVPLVVDDVLVNFDSHRAQLAAQVLKDFAAMGHQVIMFTCHEHIMRMFHQIGVQVRVLPVQGEPGEAKIYQPQPPVQKALPEPEILEPIAERQPEEPAVEDDSLWFDFENREDRWIPLEVLEEDIRHSRKVPAGWHVDNANDAGHNEAAGTRR
jgi:DNA repair exonuclease SbcCD ATPase subunit